MSETSSAEQEKRDRLRKRCQPRPMDLCTMGDGVQFFQMTVVDESKGGIGCETVASQPVPKIGDELDWCGLKRYEVRWVEKTDSGNNKIGLKISS